MSNDDLVQLYTFYKGAYYWAKELDYQDANDFGDVFDRFAIVRAKLSPAVPTELNSKLKKVFEEYQDLDFDSDSKNQMIDDLYYISEGIKGAID